MFVRMYACKDGPLLLFADRRRFSPAIIHLYNERSAPVSVTRLVSRERKSLRSSTKVTNLGSALHLLHLLTCYVAQACLNNRQYETVYYAADTSEFDCLSQVIARFILAFFSDFCHGRMLFKIKKTDYCNGMQHCGIQKKKIT